jgi:hypothetical protein
MTMRTNDNGVDRDMTETEQAAHEAWAVIAQAEEKHVPKPKPLRPLHGKQS